MDPISVFTSRMRRLRLPINYQIEKKGPEHKPEFKVKICIRNKHYESDWHVSVKKAKIDLCTNVLIDPEVDIFIQPLPQVNVSEKIMIKVFTHRSIDGDNNYEKLECLGDAILGAIMTEYYFNLGYNQHLISRNKSLMVNNTKLSEVCDKLGLSEYLLSKCDITERLKANVVEALIGAIFSEHGYDYTKTYVYGMFDLDKK